jgi:3-isopropylmalate dehydrogenase
MTEEADLVENAVRRALATGARTNDIAGSDAMGVSTRAMGDAVLREIEKAV